MWVPLTHPILGTWPATQACALAGNQTGDPLVHSLRSAPVRFPPEQELAEREPRPWVLSYNSQGCARILFTASLMSHNDSTLPILASVCLFVKRGLKLC